MTIKVIIIDFMSSILGIGHYLKKKKTLFEI